MCEFCGQSPHHPRCPNAPPPEPYFCRDCGRLISEEDDGYYRAGEDEYICRDCIDGAYTEERGRIFAEEFKEDFIRAMYDINVSGKKSSANALIAHYFHFLHNNKPEDLRTFCKDHEMWIPWLLEEEII